MIDYWEDMGMAEPIMTAQPIYNMHSYRASNITSTLMESNCKKYAMYDRIYS